MERLDVSRTPHLKSNEQVRRSAHSSPTVSVSTSLSGSRRRMSACWSWPKLLGFFFADGQAPLIRRHGAGRSCDSADMTQ